MYQLFKRNLMMLLRGIVVLLINLDISSINFNKSGIIRGRHFKLGILSNPVDLHILVKHLEYRITKLFQKNNLKRKKLKGK